MSAGVPRGVGAETTQADAPWNFEKAAPEGATQTEEARDRPQLVGVERFSVRERLNRRVRE